ncbi:hypothetical protein I350_05351 [Cryptococcus amylolentus CBS 6273]|uniref:GAR domain-containing protein n=1 Tax=Cryptococcus amylolentus CBS 6273 TaxID=1296118 RepID=A0A1E3JV81_9TREE|nr:hypothetical protein I350_05351 [Cryptococcus amylolentus CBS 6273]
MSAQGSPQQDHSQLAELVQNLDVEYGATPGNHLTLPAASATLQRDQVDNHSLSEDDAPRESGVAETAQDAKSQSLNDVDLTKQIHDLMQRVAALLDKIFQLQELRHTSSIPSSQLEHVLEALASSASEISTSVGQVQEAAASYTQQCTDADKAKCLKDGLEELDEAWTKAQNRYNGFKMDVKEDLWLSEFEASAEQVEGLMSPLSKSLLDCQEYLERFSRASGPIPEKSEFEEQLSVEGLKNLAKDHRSLLKTYMSSTNRTLKRLDKDITEKKITNGAALRRFNDISQRWIVLQSHLHKLDDRIEKVLDQITSDNLYNRHQDSGPDGMETLRDDLDEVLARAPAGRNERRTPRSSMSSNMSSSSARSANSRLSPGPLPSSSARPPLGRRRSSVFSNSSVATAHTTSQDRPRWNGSTIVDSSPPSVATPTVSRMRPSPGPVAGGIHFPSDKGNRITSPTPSNTSMASRGSRRLSRLPVYTPRSSNGLMSPQSEASHFSGSSAHITRPSLPESLSTSQLLTPNKGQSHLERARMGLKTPEPGRGVGPGGSGRPAGTFSALQPRTSSGVSTPTRARRESGVGAGSQTAPVPRFVLGRPPPSSFNSPTPTPRIPTRPASRQSAMSYAPSVSHDLSTLRPFRPSPFDLLDQSVQALLTQEAFTMEQGFFVSRVDEALKRGQRLRDGEEWKGEYVFGAGNKGCSVRRMELPGRGKDGAKRVKVLCRVGGRWVDLVEVLKERKEIVEFME